MFNTEFNSIAKHPEVDLYPSELQKQIDEMNAFYGMDRPPRFDRRTELMDARVIRGLKKEESEEKEKKLSEYDQRPRRSARLK